LEQRVSLITLGVGDLNRSRQFYERLGWRPSPSSNDSVCFFQAGGLVMGLYPRQALAKDAGIASEGSGFRGTALAYNVRTKDEVSVILDEAVAAGGELVKPAEDVFWGGHSGYFADPDGHLWEVAYNPFWTLDANGNVQLPE